MGLVVLMLEMKGVWSSVSRLNSSEDGEWRAGAVDASWYLGHGPWLVKGTHDTEMMGTAPSAISSTPSQQQPSRGRNSTSNKDVYSVRKLNTIADSSAQL